VYVNLIPHQLSQVEKGMDTLMMLDEEEGSESEEVSRRRSINRRLSIQLLTSM
jgi:hypothetical protein